MAFALASLIEIKNRDTTKHEFHVPLCDLLLDFVKQDIGSPNALKYSEIAHSLAHDLLNLAVLAGKLLWCEGVTPDESRSPDLVAIATDTENYLVSVRTAYDIIVRAVVHFGVEARNRGKIPSDSFNSLKKWIEKDPARINKFHESFRFIVDHFSHFEELKELRDRIIHRGWYPNIYTDRVRFEFFLMPSGVAELKVRRGGYKQEEHQERKPRFKRVLLLSFLQQLTQSVLQLMHQLSRAIEQQQNIHCSRTHVLSGVYVPALHHLLSYKGPPERNDQNSNPTEKRRRDIAAWYLLKAGDYLDSAERGYPDGFWWRFMVRLSEMFTHPPRYLSQPQFAKWGVLVGWDIVFQENGKNLALSLRNNIFMETNWLNGVNENLRVFSERAEAHRIVLVAEEKKYPTNGPFAEEPSGRFVIEPDPIVAAEKAFKFLSQSLSSAPP